MSRLARHVLGPLVVLVCATACSKPTFEPPDSVSPALEPLYTAIHDSRRDYEAGLELIVAGDPVSGRNLLVAASDRLSVAAELCSRTPECDAGLFADAMRQLLAEPRVSSEPEPAELPTETEPADAPVTPTAFLAGAELRDVVRRNEPVAAALNEWLTSRRPALMEAYENYQFLRPTIRPIYEEAGLPEALLFALLAKESGARVHSYSRAGAAGPLQFMPRTGRRYGLGRQEGFDLRLDPAAATRASARYLQDQLRVLNGDLAKALAAYNSGETRLLRLHRKHDGAEYWDPEIRFRLPGETRDYVPSVLAAALIFEHPEDYGVRFPAYETSISRVVLGTEASLDEIAICLGPASASDGWYRTLRNLNPRIDPATRMPVGASIAMPSKLAATYAERCGDGSKLVRLARELHAAAYPLRPELIRYTVRRGDTLAAIADRFDCESVEPLVQVNRLRGPSYPLRVGQLLNIPRCG